jgi:predicted phosphodiesterase
MRYALFSDIHNNTPALEKILTDIERRAVGTLFCLGDIGVDACTDIVRAANIPTVFGNWEEANWNFLSEQNSAWVLGLPPMLKHDGFWVTHAGPFWPPHIKSLSDMFADRPMRTSDRLFPYLHYEEDKLWETIATLAETTVPVMFHGHTHRQLAWRLTRSNKLQRVSEPRINLMPGEIYVVGVGSVGRPADGPGTAYAIFDDEKHTVDMIKIH